MVPGGPPLDSVDLDVGGRFHSLLAGGLMERAFFPGLPGLAPGAKPAEHPMLSEEAHTHTQQTL